jgi:hypothetical protein
LMLLKLAVDSPKDSFRAKFFIALYFRLLKWRTRIYNAYTRKWFWERVSR